MSIITPGDTISLIGQQLSGKTTIGKGLAQKSGKKSIDLDVATTERKIHTLTLLDITQMTGKDVNSLIGSFPTGLLNRINGQKLNISDLPRIFGDEWHLENGFFRMAETEVYSDVLHEVPIISTGGGTLTIERNRDIARDSIKVLIDISAEQQRKRLESGDKEGDSRRGTLTKVSTDTALSPIDSKMQELNLLREQRNSLFRNIADVAIVIDDDRDNDDIVKELLSIQKIQDRLKI